MEVLSVNVILFLDLTTSCYEKCNYIGLLAGIEPAALPFIYRVSKKKLDTV
jgi:hypothetical protein